VWSAVLLSIVGVLIAGIGLWMSFRMNKGFTDIKYEIRTYHRKAEYYLTKIYEEIT